MKTHGAGAPRAQNPHEADLMNQAAEKLRQAATERRQEGDEKGAKSDEQLADRFERRARGQDVY
jgi:hypothetical protein